MKRKDERFTVSTEHVGIRTAAFILVFAVAVGAFGFAFSRLGYKEPGYYEIEAPANDEAPHYRVGFSLVYRFEGESDEIKLRLRELETLYSGVLLRSYQLLDTERTYEGMVNLATLNANLGREVRVSQELYTVLLDGWEKTREGRGANLFAGALLAEWDSMLSLDDLSEFDPALHPERARRLEVLAEETGKLAHFSLEAKESRDVTVSVSQEYLRFLEEHEYGGAILTTGRLTDAYRLEMIRNALEERGFTNGYLTTDSGLTLSLSGHTGGEYALYGFDGEEVRRCASLPAEPHSACSFLRAFPMEAGEIMYHHIADEAGERYYHPAFSLTAGDFPGILASSCVVRYDGDIVAACYENLSLYGLTGREEIGAVGPEGATVACTFLGDTEAVVYTNNLAAVNGGEGSDLRAFP